MIFSDITERHLLEMKLEQKNQELSDFSHRVSHDFKSIINLTVGFGQEIERDPSLFSELFPYIKTNLQTGQILIERLLKLAGAGKVIGRMEEIDLQHVLSYVLGNFQNTEVPLETIIDLKHPTALGDPDSIILIFINLIENAIKYQDTLKDKLILEISSKKSGNNIIIAVRDNGIGIEENCLDKIFQPGVALSKDKGTGFGLTIVKKLIDAHKGSIKAISEGNNKGTTMIITLPLTITSKMKAALNNS